MVVRRVCVLQLGNFASLGDAAAFAAILLLLLWDLLFLASLRWHLTKWHHNDSYFTKKLVLARSSLPSLGYDKSLSLRDFHGVDRLTPSSLLPPPPPPPPPPVFFSNGIKNLFSCSHFATSNNE